MQHLAPRKILFERVGPCDTLSCFFFSALWLQRSQFTLVQDIQSTKDTNLTCFKTFPINATLCLQSGPISLEWPVDPFAEFDQSRPSFSPEDPIVVQQRGDFPGFTRSFSSQDALPPPPQVLQSTAGWNMDVAISFTDVCGVLLGIPGVSLARFFQPEEQRIPTQISQDAI